MDPNTPNVLMRRLAFHIGPASQILAVEHQENQRVALGPIRTIDCVEPHASIPKVNLETVPIVLQLVPSQAERAVAWRRSGWHGWMKAADAF
jgi:hypothetical protein